MKYSFNDWLLMLMEGQEDFDVPDPEKPIDLDGFVEHIKEHFKWTSASPPTKKP